MAIGKEIKNRIKSVKSTKKITKAMELTAAAKMKRAVSAALASRLYAKYSWEVLVSIGKNGQNGAEIKSPFFAGHEKTAEVRLPQDGGSPTFANAEEKILLILFTSNRGLCGAYNAQIIKKVLAMFKEQEVSQRAPLTSLSKVPFDIVAVGKKGDVAMRRIGQSILASFFELPDDASLSEISPISKMAIEEFSSGRYDKVFVAYTDFVSALSQKPNIRQLIPITRTGLKEMIESIGENKDAQIASEKTVDYLFEGEKDVMVGNLALKLVRMQLYQMYLESEASEQSSRMLAMKNASEAAGEMIEDLTLVFNKARQAGITREISEISAGMASVN